VLATGSDNGHFVFNYVHHGQDWRLAHCGSRERQSPIALDHRVMTLNTTSKTLFFNYQMIDGDLVFQNDGHSLAVDLAGQGYGGITYEGGWYNIININFHAKSEHTYDGMHMPMELHLVHKRYDGPQIIVVAIPIDCEGKPDIDLEPPIPYDPAARKLYAEDMTRTVIDFPNPALLQQRKKGKSSLRNGRKSGRGPWYPANERPYEPPSATEPNSNPVFQKFVSQLPPKLMRTTRIEGSEIAPLNLNELMEGGTYVEYEGSFTVPPCSETIQWFVKREPVMASDSEVRILYETIYEMTDDVGNYRSVMPLSGRTVTIVNSVKSEPIQGQKNKAQGCGFFNSAVPGEDLGKRCYDKGEIECSSCQGA
jgi:carbonic anhydrase